MGLRIGTNIAAFAAQRHLSRNESQTSHAMKALASGSRLVNAGDDAAGFAIAESLRGQAASLRQAKQNSDSAGGMIQVAEGGLNEQNNILIRLRELAMQAASDTFGDDEREFLSTEFKSLIAEFDRIAVTTTYGRRQLLSGSNEEFEFHLGTGNGQADVVKYRFESDTRAASLDLTNMDIRDRDDAAETLQTIDAAMYKVAQARSSFGAVQSRFEIAGNNIEIQRENIMAARSRIADTDIAEEVTRLTQAQVLRDFGISVLAQANQDPMRALKLLA